MRRCSRPLVSWTLALVLAGAHSVATAEPAPAAGQRPRVGLVLSGGGARGIAHIGVIRVLERERVPIDLVTGTSMGSIIGGLYAAGYSPDEMEKIVDGIDWADAFDDAPPRARRSFRRKEDDLNFLTALKVGVKDGGIALPWGLVQGQKLNLILRRLFLQVAEVRDFDALHVPFRAVSTDVVTGEAVVHGSGDLAGAIRASMSLPGVFAPVDLDGQLLVDGGIANNMPVDVALAMGADVLIVVDVGTPLAERDDITSAASIVSQLTSLLVVGSTKQQMALMRPQDIFMRPDLEGVSTASFEQGSAVAPRGEQAALTKLDELRRLALPEAEYAARVERQRRGRFEAPRVAEVRVTNDSQLADEVLQTRLATEAGQTLDLAQLEGDLQEIYGLDSFERVDYALDPGENGTVLRIEAKEKSWGPQYLRFGLNLEENFEGSSDYNILINYTVQPRGPLGGEWRNELQVGHTLRLFTELWQPLEPESRWFVAPSFELRRDRVPVYDGDDQTGEFMVRHTNAGLDLGRQLSNWGEIRLGIAYDIGHARPIAGVGFEADDLRAGGGFLRLRTDTLDNVHFPRSGSYSYLSAGLVRKALGAKDSFELIQAGLAKALTYRDNTALASFETGVSYGRNAEEVLLARLGGFLNLSGMDAGQVAGNNYALARVLAYRRVAAPGALSFTYPLYLGFSFEAGNAWDDRDDYLEEMLLAGAAYFGMETPLGPIYFGYGYTEGGRDAVYLYLGRTF